MEYGSCVECGEFYEAALRVGKEPLRCANCADATHPHHDCTICVRVLPCQDHHVGPKQIYKDFTIWLCLNCHRILNIRQFRWRRDGSAERHPLRYLVQGVWDVVVLWSERSPVATQCRALLKMLGQAALLLVPCMHPTALAAMTGGGGLGGFP